jgi:TRAP-type C4-dicarboxylate transport system permease small subunit
MSHAAAAAGRIMKVVGELGAGLSAVILVAMICAILLDIGLRNFAGTSLGFVGELVGYGVAAITFNSLAYAFQKDALIRVNLVAGLAARSPLIGRILEVAALLLTLAVIGLAATFFWQSVLRHYARGSVSETGAEVPLWIAEGLMFLGLTLFCLQLVVALVNLIAGNREYAGPPLAADDTVLSERADNIGG